jgi:hypothetical protein
MSVIRHDFGLDRQRAPRRFRKLLNLDALHEANVRANPVPYLERASERIFQLEKLLFEAVEAGTARAGEPTSTEVVTVDNARYQQLLKCFAIVEAGFAKLRSDDDTSD